MGPAAPGDSPLGRLAGPQESIQRWAGVGLGEGQSRSSSHQHQAKFGLSLTSIARMRCCTFPSVRLNADVVRVSDVDVVMLFFSGSWR